MSELTLKGNAGYAANVVEVTEKNLVALPGLDNLNALHALGYQALVSKDIKPGTRVLLFPAETQLHEDFAAHNNLFRHSMFNADPAQKGYLEDNLRVRAIKLRGHRSDALVLPVSSVNFLTALYGAEPFGAWEWELSSNQIFDHVGGTEICRKYVRPGSERSNQPAQPKKVRVATKFFPEHFDTTRYAGNEHLIPGDAHVTVTQKLHGTSVRLANVPVERTLSRWEKVLKWLRLPVQTEEYAVVSGSRRVTKSIGGEGLPDRDHWYGVAGDVWTEVGQEVGELIPKNFVVFGEIIGWTADNKPIQKGYTYNLPVGEHALYVYRVAQVNPDGLLIDLPWGAVKQFCRERGLEHVPELSNGLHEDFEMDEYLDIRYFEDPDIMPENPVPLSDPKSVDEGVAIRWDGAGYQPVVLKHKSPQFFQYETKNLDADVVDIEAEEG